MKLKDMKKVIDLTIKNGGHTVDIGGRYMVSLKDYEVIIPLKDITATHLLDYYNCILPKKDNHTLGTWLNNNMVYIDTSISINNLSDAVKLAKKHKQLAIYDTKKNIEILV